MTVKAFRGHSIGGFCWLVWFCCGTPVTAPRPPQPVHRDRDLIVRGRVTEQTQSIRRDLLTRLTAWLAEQVPGETLEELARHHIDRLSELLEEYMIHMYVSGHNRRSAAETLNVVTQQYGWVRFCLAAPWGVLRTWENLEPVTHHPPIPQAVLHACVATALSWKWERFAVLLLLGFYALLRPSELIMLRRRDISIPGDHLETGVLYIRIGLPKTRNQAARNQHVRMDEADVVMWVTQILTLVPMWSRIWSGSLSSFKLRFDHIQRHLLQSKPFLPSSLRPGGATFLFRLWDENLPRLQWRGRWRSFRMLEIYVQELGAAEVWIRFPPKIRAKVFLLGSLFSQLLIASRLPADGAECSSK